jgi:hypothetical protein
MSEQWYWRKKGETRGPFTTAELDTLVRDHRIADHDQVRLDGSDRWLSAREIREMFEQSRGTPSEAASELLSQANLRQLQRAFEPPPRTSLVSAPFRGLGSGIAALIQNGIDRLIELASPLAVLKPLFSRTALLGLVALVLLAILFKDVSIFHTQHRKLFERIAVTWQRLDSLSGEEASSADWQALSSETRPWLDPAIERLEESSQDKPVMQDYWFGFGRDEAVIIRDLLLAAKSLRTALETQTLTPETAAEYELHMTNAQQYLSGELSAANPGAPRLPDEEGPLFAVSREQTSDPETRLSPTMMGLLIFDGLLVAGGLLYWWRRSQNA